MSIGNYDILRRVRCPKCNEQKPYLVMGGMCIACLQLGFQEQQKLLKRCFDFLGVVSDIDCDETYDQLMVDLETALKE